LCRIRSFLKEGRRLGSFVNLFSTREEAERFGARLEEEYEILGLWTRKISEEDEHPWETVAFDDEGGFEPGGKTLRPDV
jgi:hypothetical protein